MIFYDDFLTALRSLDASIDEDEALRIFTSMYTSTRTVYSSTGCCLHQAVQALEFTPFIAGAIDKETLLHAVRYDCCERLETMTTYARISLYHLVLTMVALSVPFRQPR